MTDSTAIAPAGQRSAFWDADLFSQIQRTAKAFVHSAIVPKHFQGEDHLGDAVVALAMAHDLGENPLTFMQSIFIVHGTAGYSSKWLIGKVNASPAFRGRMRFRVERGEPIKHKGASYQGLTVTAYATDAETGEEITETVTMQTAIDEGWASNPKYRTMPEVMLRYRAATFFVRFNAPELLYGMPTADELEDIAVRDVTPTAARPVMSLADAVANEKSAALPDHGDTIDAEEIAEPAAEPAHVVNDHGQAEMGMPS